MIFKNLFLLVGLVPFSHAADTGRRLGSLRALDDKGDTTTNLYITCDGAKRSCYAGREECIAGKCRCLRGWTGDRCDADIDECKLGGVCAFKGSFCVDHDPDDAEMPFFYCGCDANKGWLDGTNPPGPNGQESCIKDETVDEMVIVIVNETENETVDEIVEIIEIVDETADQKAVCGSAAKPCNMAGQYCEETDGSNNCLCASGWIQPAGEGAPCQELKQCELGIDTVCDKTGRDTGNPVSMCIEATVAQHSRGYKCRCLVEDGFVAVPNTEDGTNCMPAPTPAPSLVPSSGPSAAAEEVELPLPAPLKYCGDQVVCAGVDKGQFCAEESRRCACLSPEWVEVNRTSDRLVECQLCINSETMLQAAVAEAPDTQGAPQSLIIMCANAEIDLTSEIDLTGKQLLLKCETGSTSCTINGNGSTRLFSAKSTANSTLTFESITFKGGSVTGDDGGAFLLESTDVTFDSCHFSDNKAGNGGALYNKDGILTMNGATTFDQNTADEAGGAVYNSRGEMHFSGDATFSGNEALGNGGAIYDENGLMIFNQSTAFFEFSDNKSAQRGGALYTTEGYIRFFDDLIFSGNEAGTDGGAVYGSGQFLYLVFTGNTTFTDNKAAENGGAIHNSQGVCELVGGTYFNGNTASERGGAAYNFEGLIVFGAVSTFSGNKASKDAGALYNDKGRGSNMLFFAAATFTDNKVDEVGGAVYNSGGDMDFKDTLTFSGNEAIGNAGALYNDGTLNCRGPSTFSDNKSAQHGGALFNAESPSSMPSTITFGINSTFSGNEAVLDGGAIYNDMKSTLTLNGPATFTDNIAANNGGAYYSDGFLSANEIMILSGNSAGGDGGAMYMQSTAFEGTITNVTYSDNTAGGEGGAVFVKSGGQLSRVVMPTYSNNMATVACPDIKKEGPAPICQ